MGKGIKNTVWEDIKGYEGFYQVSIEGVVRSRLRAGSEGTQVKDEWHVLEQSLSLSYSPGVWLINPSVISPEGNPSSPHKREHRHVARLVLEAFVGPAPTPNHEALRLDSNFENVELSNLKWGTRKDFMRILKQNGRMAVGEQLPHHKLCREEVEGIKDELINGFLTMAEIAEVFDVGYAAVRDIKVNRSWKHIPWPGGELNNYTFRDCNLCGEKFKTDRFVEGGGAIEKYCSGKCRDNQEKLWAIGKTYEEHFGIFEGDCICCGQPYEVDLSVRLDGEQPDYFSKKYCSRKCSKRYSYLKSTGKSYREVYGHREPPKENYAKRVQD